MKALRLFGQQQIQVPRQNLDDDSYPERFFTASAIGTNSAM